MSAARVMTAEEKEEWKKERKSYLPIFLPQLVLSVAVTASVLYGGYYMCDCIPVPLSNDLGDKLTFYIRCCVFPCAVLLFCSIMGVANKRGSTPAANPLAGKDHFLVVEKNFLMNTVEQTLVFLMITLTLTSYLDASEMKILPIYSILWFAARIFFRIGYGINPRYRYFGMLISMGTSVIFISVLFYLAYTRGFLSSVSSIPGGGTGNVPRSDEL